MRAHRRWHLWIWLILPFILGSIMVMGLIVHKSKNPIKLGFQTITKAP